jgi:hypothetical protein
MCRVLSGSPSIDVLNLTLATYLNRKLDVLSELIPNFGVSANL